MVIKVKPIKVYNLESRYFYKLYKIFYNIKKNCSGPLRLIA